MGWICNKEQGMEKIIFLLLIITGFAFSQEQDPSIFGYQVTIYTLESEPSFYDATFSGGDSMTIEWNGTPPATIKSGWLTGSLVENYNILSSEVTWGSGSATVVKEITLDPGNYQMRIRKIGDQSYYGENYLSDYSNRQDFKLLSNKPASIIFKISVN